MRTWSRGGRDRAKVRLSATAEVRHAWLVDLLERDGGTVEFDGRNVLMTLRPLEIATVRLRLASRSRNLCALSARQKCQR